MISLITIDITLGGGIERVVINKANSFYLKGYKVSIFSFFKTNKTPRYHLNPDIEIKYLSNLKFKNIYHLRFSFLLLKLFLIIPKSSNLISFYPIISIPLALSKYRKSTIASEHSEYYSQSRIIQILRIKTYNRLKAVVTLTTAGRIEFNKNGVRAIQIPNFSNFKNSAVKKLSFPIYVVFIGRLEEVKNPLAFISIAEWFAINSALEIKFKMYGDGALKNGVERRIRKMSNIEYCGFSSDIETILERSHGLILTSKTEAFPMVAIESVIKNTLVYGFTSQIGTSEILGKGSPRIFNEKNIEGLCIQIINDFHSQESYLSAQEQNSINAKLYSEEVVFNSWIKLIEN